MTGNDTQITTEQLGLNALATNIHTHNRAKGFYEEYEQTVNALRGDPNLKEAYHKCFVAQRLALMHSELSEGLEGSRKGLMDDHLPDLTSLEVELADTFIRIMDTVGFLGIDIQTAIDRKLAYNQGRPYKHGKSY